MTDLPYIESQLKKRLDYPYSWKSIQKNSLDLKSNFIYNTYSFNELLEKIEHIFKDEKDYDILFNYSLNRWYNFHSAMAVEHIFNKHKKVKRVKNSKDKEKDFFIDSIPFDHKTSVFPKKLNVSFNQAINNKEKVCKWLYENQSKQGRFHLKNRLFVMLFDKNGEHWKLKANLGKVAEVVDLYLNHFRYENLINLQFEENKSALTDIIWLIK